MKPVENAGIYTKKIHLSLNLEHSILDTVHEIFLIFSICSRCCLTLRGVKYTSLHVETSIQTSDAVTVY